MDFTIDTLGPCTITSPLVERRLISSNALVPDTRRVLCDVEIDGATGLAIDPAQSFEKGGPREKIHFNPATVRAAIVTCGGLCPGLNDVIRSIVMESWYRYGVRSILGIRYGYGGLLPDATTPPVELTPDIVKDIHTFGGTMLGSSRGGGEDMNRQVEMLMKLGINILYTVGGDGTLRGAHQLATIARERKLPIAVVGIPKTIDNDINYIHRSFGFITAVSEADKVVDAAHVEAMGAPNGIGLVKLMGRNSGAIAASTVIANNDVNFVLVPENRFDLEGPNGFLTHLERRIRNRQHAVICVAEGAGQELLKQDAGAQAKDASGNVKLKDIGLFLRDAIEKYCKGKGLQVNIKYIDPSYIIRSTRANAEDSLFCTELGQFAVHAGMAGKTDLVIGGWNNICIHVPIELAIAEKKSVDTDSLFWLNVISATGQPMNMVNG